MKTSTQIESLFQYADMGWSIIPIKPNSKQPAIDWKSFQTTPATKEQISQWYQALPNCNWAVVTGKVSNLFLVDCDSPEAEQAAEELGLTNGCSVSTPHGRHFYFNYNNDGKNRKTISGYGSNGTYWPQIKGLDARSDGGYALLPPSSGYEWDIEEEIIEEEITDYKDWQGATFPEAQQQTLPASQPTTKMYGSKFSDLDLTNVEAYGTTKPQNKTRAKFAEIASQYTSGKIPRGGSGIHDATYAFLAEEALIVGIGPALEEAGHKFMEEFFESPLTDGRFETSLATVRRKERENHPERFDINGNYIHHLSESAFNKLKSNIIQPTPKTLSMSQLLKYAEHKVEYWQVPWLPKPSIVQVFGYSGHGKSLFLQHALFYAACNTDFGPFERGESAPKILYFDLENGRHTLARRAKSIMQLTNKKPIHDIQFWTPWFEQKEINLRQPTGIQQLFALALEQKPDIIVLDTIRTAFLGVQENNAEEWAAINRLLLRLRNEGITVIFVHHSNKPSADGLGREAGSSNQLTTVDVQLRITQVFPDKETAKSKGGIYTGDLLDDPFSTLKKPKGSRLKTVFEISYGKVREMTDLHTDRAYFGLGERTDSTIFLTATPSPKQTLKSLISGQNKTRAEVLREMNMPEAQLERWCTEMGISLPKK